MLTQQAEEKLLARKKSGRGETNAFKTKLELFHTQPSVQHDFLPWEIVNVSPEVRV